jgi:hypothetical protein
MPPLETTKAGREMVHARSSVRPAAARDVPPARWQLHLVLASGALCCVLGALLGFADERALGYDAERPATTVVCGALAMAVAAIALLRGRGGGLTLGPRACRVTTPRGGLWVPWAAVAEVRVEHRWYGSFVVLELGEGQEPVRLSCAGMRREPHRLRNLIEGWRSAAREEPYQRMPAPLWEARRSLRRLLLATLLVPAIAIALSPIEPAGVFSLPWLVAPLAIALPPALSAACLGDGHEYDERLGRDVRDRGVNARAWLTFTALLAVWTPLLFATSYAWLAA